MAFFKSIDTPGVSAEVMGRYIKYVADRLLTDLGYGKAYNESTSNPCEWMEHLPTKVYVQFYPSHSFRPRRSSLLKLALLSRPRSRSVVNQCLSAKISRQGSNCVVVQIYCYFFFFN